MRKDQNMFAHSRDGQCLRHECSARVHLAATAHPQCGRPLEGRSNSPTAVAGARKGFTLVEVAIATAVVGLGMVALFMSLGAGTRTNAEGVKLTQATLLSQEIREWTCKLPFSDKDTAQKNNPPGPDSGETAADDLDDLYVADGLTFQAPRDARGLPITDMPGWSEKVTITYRDPADLTRTVTAGSSDVVNVKVQILYQNREVLTTDWLAARKS